LGAAGAPAGRRRRLFGEHDSAAPAGGSLATVDASRAYLGRLLA
jgi:hypothetical protein